MVNLIRIGLFRSRKRVDVSDCHILTREIKGSASVMYNEADNTKYAVGEIHLRSPRGVGQYDFRYFRVSEARDSDDDEDPGVTLPLARSSAVSVEVQGGSLFEAIQYVVSSFDVSVRIESKL